MREHSDEFDLSKLSRSSLTRRRFLQGGLAAGAAVATTGLAASFAPPSFASARRSTAMLGTPRRAETSSLVPTPRDQTVIFDSNGVLTVYNSFNPLIPNGEQYQGGITQVCKECLFYINAATGQLQRWQATGWTYNSDFSRCTLHLRPGVTWNDGNAFTSADVAFTTKLMKDNANQIGGYANAAWTAEVDSVDTPDPHTAVFNLNTVDPRFHYNFICQIVFANLLVLPEHVWAGKNITTFKNDPPVYTGPYTLKDADQDLEMFIWEKSPRYWGKALMDPAPQYVVFRNQPADADLDNEQFMNGQIDQLNSATAYTFAKGLQAGGNKNVVITPFVDSDQRAIIPNCDPSRGALADPRYRYAISMLIDRQKVIDDIWFLPTTADTYPWPSYPNMNRWNNGHIAQAYAEYRTYNPTRAGQLLDELGIKLRSDGKRYFNGKPFTQTVITPQSAQGTQAAEYVIGQLLVEEMQKVGIDATLKQPTNAVYSELVTNGNYDLRSEWFGGGLLDPYQAYQQFDSAYYEPLGHASLGYDQMRLKEPGFEATIKKLSKLSPTAPSSASTYGDALEDYYKYLPVIPYIQSVYAHVSNNQYWTNWPTGNNLYEIPSNWWGQYLFVIGNLKPARSHQ